jgi:cytidyltransferase-like protein
MGRNFIISIASGYFNPVHKGHLELLKRAKSFSDLLIVIVNNDYQRSLKGSKEFQDESERVEIIENIKHVDHVELSIDEDRSVIKTIEKIFNKYSKLYGGDRDIQFFFVNGGDQFSNSVAEKEICEKLGIYMIDGLGGKIQSSSTILKK